MKINPLPTQEEAIALGYHFTDVYGGDAYSPPPDNVRLTILVKSTGIRVDNGTPRTQWFAFNITSDGMIGVSILAWIKHDQFIDLLEKHRAKIVS